jgi:hypothetical protein
VPPGFVCFGAELGMVACHWALTDSGGGGRLEAAALDAACAFTVAEPAATVECIVLD